MHRALLVALALAGCGGPRAAPAAAPASVEPDAAVLRRIRFDAARALGCSAAAVRVAPVAGAPSRYEARGCGWRAVYVVACDAPDVCEFVIAEDPSLSP